MQQVSCKYLRGGLLLLISLLVFFLPGRNLPAWADAGGIISRPDLVMQNDHSNAKDEPQRQRETVVVNDGSQATDVGTRMTFVLTKYKLFVTAFLALSVFSMVGLMIKSIMSLGLQANNPGGRLMASVALGIEFMATIMLGAVTLLFGLGFNAF